MTQINKDDASLGKTLQSGKVVAIIVASLSISIITLIIATIMTFGLHSSWRSARDQIRSAPEIDKNNAIIAARTASRAAEIQSAAIARAKLHKIRSLTADEAAHVMTIVQSQLRAKLSPAQFQALTTELQKPDQQLVDPALTISTTRTALRGQPPFQVVLADTGGMGDGMSIRFETLRCYLSKDDRETSSMYIDPAGHLSRVSFKSAVERASMVKRGNAVQLNSRFIPQWQAEEKLDFALMICTATELAVAVILFFAGVQALLGQQRWTFYHRVYVWVQLSVLAAAVLIWFGNMRNDEAEASFPIVLSIICAIYPVVLIFVLPSRLKVSSV